MKATELIKTLQNIVDTDGDFEVLIESRYEIETVTGVTPPHHDIPWVDWSRESNRIKKGVSRTLKPNLGP